MNWFYTLAGQQAGPVPESDLSRLVSEGTISATTLVWRAGMPDWQPASAALPALVGTGEGPQIAGLAIAPDQKDLLVQQLREGVAITAPGALGYAGFWIRALAFFIDWIILQVVQTMLTMVFAVFTAATGDREHPELQLALGLGIAFVSLAVSMAYHVIMVGKYGATLGKMALGLKIVRADGSRVSMGLATGRYFAGMLSGLILGIGYIIAAFDDEKRALHDHLCGTRVIKTR